MSQSLTPLGLAIACLSTLLACQWGPAHRIQPTGKRLIEKAQVDTAPLDTELLEAYWDTSMFRVTVSLSNISKHDVHIDPEETFLEVVRWESVDTSELATDEELLTPAAMRLDRAGMPATIIQLKSDSLAAIGERLLFQFYGPYVTEYGSDRKRNEHGKDFVHDSAELVIPANERATISGIFHANHVKEALFSLALTEAQTYSRRRIEFVLTAVEGFVGSARP